MPGPNDFARAMPRSLQDLLRIQDNIVETGLVHGDIPALYSPQFQPVLEASLSLEANDPVFVVPTSDGIRIYPQRILVWHEVVNELVNGKPFCVTYSPISGSLAVYESQVDNINLMIDAQGALYNNNSILIDRNTGSLWSQMLGMAFSGDLLGSGLKILPCYWTTWSFARQVFPDARVMQIPRSSGRNYNRDPYGSYLTPGNYYDDERILYQLSHLDSRMRAKDQVIGLEMAENLIAINVDYVKEHRVVNFYLGLEALAAWHDTRLNVVRIFSRQVWEGQTPALFSLNENGNLYDIQTRSIWNLDGLCVQGNLAGASLQEQFGIYAFWFAWAAFHPESATVPGNSVVPDSALAIGQ